MEEIIDFEKLIVMPEVNYVATFDPSTGNVLAVGPTYAFTDKDYQVPVDQETAELIIEGTIRISSCFVDVAGGTFEIAEVKAVTKLDDVLHRIVETTWTQIDKPDIFVCYDKEQESLTFELTEEFYGTKKLLEKFQPVAQRKVIWSGDTEMNFLITEYNDPNILYSMISITVADLVGQKKVLTDVKLPEKFSIYTRRIFKNYVLEVL